MSVMTQLHATCRSSIINSSADVKPLALYSNERSASTSATRKGASSSMIAIKDSCDTFLTASIVSALILVSSFPVPDRQLKRNCEGSQNMRLSQVRKSTGIIQGYY